jgi:hypothetical protein
MEAMDSPENLLTTYKATRFHKAEGYRLNIH